MNRSLISWGSINDKDFEVLSLYLSEVEMPDMNMDLYLKNGNKQDGIDIYTFNFSNGKNICIQCKHALLTLQDLKNIISEFESGKFFRKTDKFIVTTTADLQKENLRSYIDQQVERFKNEHDIELQWWDKGNIEQKLAKCFMLVSKFFGKNVADEHCFSANRHSPTCYTPVENFIERAILKIDEDDKFDEYRFYYGIKSTIQLKSLFDSNHLSVVKVCLISDAYQGKTTLFEQLAYDLSTGENRYIPILIKIKTHSIKPIESILDDSYAFWKKYPSKELVIILDGLDEVPKSKFDEYTTYINEFSNSYPSVSVIFSCRKLFYSHYRIYNIASKFTFYELSPLKDNQITFYVEKLLKDNKDAFYEYISCHNLTRFLHDPFYLNNLVKLFIKSPSANSLPKNKNEVLHYIIGESFTPLENRKLSDGSQLHQLKIRYRLCIKKMALAAQILGLNNIDSEIIQELFTSTDTELLLQSSVLTCSDGNWTFNNAFFQESFAALALLGMPYEETEKMISVGNKFKKVKTKWIQTIASLISLLDESDDVRVRLISLFENDNIELLTFCDASKLTIEFRLEIINKIVEKCINRNSYPHLIQADIMANFIKDKSNGLAYLLVKLESDPAAYIKMLCWRIVYYHDTLFSFDKKYKELILKELSCTDEGSYAALLINVLSKFNLADISLIDELASKSNLIGNYDYLNSLYDLIVNKKLVDKYYGLALNGISVYANYDRGTIHLFAEKTLEKYLLLTEDSNNILSLLKMISTTEWKSFSENMYTKDEKNIFFSSLIKKAIVAYKTNKTILLPLSVIVKREINLSQNKEFTLLLDFFDATNTRLLLFKLCLKNKPELWNLGQIINESCFEYIFFEFEEGDITEYDLQNWYYSIRYSQKEDMSQKFYSEILAITGNDFVKRQEQSNIEHQAFQNQKNENDIKFMQSPEAFIEGLKLFFRAFGKNKIPQNDLFVGALNNPPRQKADSHFIANFFLHFDIKKNEVSLSECIKSVQNAEWFSYFRAKEILRYNFPSKEARESLMPILENYYTTEIANAAFPNSIRQKGNTYRFNWKEKLLTDIYEKYLFNTEENFLVQMIWQVNDGFNHLKKPNFGSEHKKKLSTLIIENVNIELLTNTIVSNIKSGIEADQVLNSHLELCRFLKIGDVSDFILDQIKSNKFRDRDYFYILEVYVEITNEKSKLLDLLLDIDDYNSELFIELVKILKDQYSSEVSKLLLRIFDNSSINKERKSELAYYLAETGNTIGFSALIDNLGYHDIAIVPSPRVPELNKFDTFFALNELKRVIDHVLDAELPHNPFHTPSIKDFILDCLYKLSAKSESDMILVEEFLNAAIIELQPTRLNAKSLYFHIDRIVENFRASDKYTYKLTDVKNILAHI